MAATTRTSSSARAFAHLRFDGVSFSYGAQRVLTDISFTAPAGTRTGLIGENGSGKSTLLRLAAGLLVPDVGTITATAPGDASPRIGLLHQEVPFSPTATVAQALESAVAHLRSCLLGVEAAAERLAAASDEHAERAAVDYDRALESAERLGVWDVDARIDRMMAGLGLGVLPRDRPTGALSGGQRSRLALAWLLLSAPDVLLLDEPTNHLDDAATAYLCAVLSQWGGPVLVVSHDRAFLDEVVTHLVDLDPSPQPNALAAPLVQDGPGAGIGISRFTGTYSDDLQARRDIRDRWEHRYESEQAELRRLRAAIQENQVVGHPGREPRTEARSARKFYADRNAMTVSRRVNDARGRLDDLEKSQLRKPPPELHFRGLTLAGSQPPCQRDSGSPPVVLDAQDVAVAGRLSPTSLTVRSTQKWLVTGANGVGKSTLLHLFAGDLSPTSGTVTRADGVRVGLLAQESVLLDPCGRGPARTAREAYADIVGEATAERVPLSTFGLLAPRDEMRPVETLSVGQKRRLALAVLIADPPEVLLLDEPTNHLSLALVTELEKAIADYPGAVVMASHDRWIRRRWHGKHLDLRRQ